MTLLEDILTFVSANQKVCPREGAWQQLSELIANPATKVDSSTGLLPLITEAWDRTSVLMKRQRLKAQLKAAEVGGTLADAANFLYTLPDEQWARERDFTLSVPSDLAGNGPPRIDPLARTVSIFVQVIDGRLVRFGGAELPTLGPCVGDLIVPAHAIQDPAERENLIKEEVRDVLPADSVVRLRLSARHVPPDMLAKCQFHRVSSELLHSPFVEVVLDEPLQLRSRGTKAARIEPLDCHVPALDDVHCTTLNEAYTRISKVFEPTRRGPGGNVYRNAYFYSELRHRWLPLGSMRGDILFEAT